jgi:rubrerythrin
MFTDFNANEIFQVGVEIERNGKTFYETAAGQTGDSTAQELFDRLAKWEHQHIQLFEDLRRKLRECEISVPSLASVMAQEIAAKDGISYGLELLNKIARRVRVQQCPRHPIRRSAGERRSPVRHGV